MNLFRDCSLRTKLTGVMLLTTLAALALACGGFLAYDHFSARRELERDLRALAEMAGHNSAAALEFRDARAAAEALRALRQRPAIEFACVFDRAGQAFASYRRETAGPVTLPRDVQEAERWRASGRLLLSQPIRLHGERVGAIYLQANLTQLHERFWQYGKISAVVMLFALLAGLVVSNRLQRVVSEPLAALAETARVVTEEKDYSIRAPQRSGDDTGLLVKAFNQMLDRIQERERQLNTANQDLERRVTERTVALERELEVRRQAEAALDQSRRAYLELVDSLDSIVWEAAADTLAITFISEQAERLLGYPRARWTTDQRFRHTCLHPEDRERVLATSRREIAACRAHAIEYRMVAHDERIVWIRDLVTVVVEHGRPVKVRGVMVDITASKAAEEAIRKTEEQLRHSQKMEAIGRLAGGVAHDFNNLLTVINGYTELLSKQVRGNESQSRLVSEVQRASQRAAGLTNQLLAFGRKQVLQPRPLDLNQVVAGMEKMLRRVLGEDIELAIRFDSTLAPVRADLGQLEQVILNLAINSRDAMPRGGRLVIQTRNVTTSEPLEFSDGAMQPGKYVALSIRDDGTGMDETVAAHLFEPFFTTKEPGKGTGLGLATSYGIIKQSGGFIQVSTAPGVGTEMCIYLAAEAMAAAAAPAEPVDTELPLGRERLLLVEDEPAVRDLVVCVLRECGYDVLEAGNGAEGLRVLRDHSDRKIDLVISDCIMPQMNGKDMVDRLRLSHPGTKVLFVSGYTDDMLAGQGVFESGAAFLQKPFTPQLFARKVREVLDRAASSVN